MSFKRWLLGLLLVPWAALAQAFNLQVEPVAGNAYAIVGEIGPRKLENHALNNTLGFVVTEKGVVLISSGATPAGAALVEKAVASVTPQPIRLVVNIGVQDHHWMGNSYFANKGIPIKALKRTVANQREQTDAHLARLTTEIGAEARTIVPVYATDVIDADRQSFELGGVAFELLWPGGGHFAGDALLWLPQSRTLFTGDYVFLDRMLGIHPTTPVAQWQQSFHEIEKLEPLHVVPGHGHAGDMDKARRDTGNYLDWLTAEVGKALEEWQDLEDVVAQLGNAPQFARLKFFQGWHKRNINQTYLQLEAAR